MDATSPDPDWFLDNVLIYAEPGGGTAITGPAGWWAKWWHDRSLDLGDSALGRVARDQGFVLTTAQAHDCGLSAADIRRGSR